MFDNYRQWLISRPIYFSAAIPLSLLTQSCCQVEVIQCRSLVFLLGSSATCHIKLRQTTQKITTFFMLLVGNTTHWFFWWSIPRLEDFSQVGSRYCGYKRTYWDVCVKTRLWKAWLFVCNGMPVREGALNREEITRINKSSVDCLLATWLVYWAKLMDSLWVRVRSNSKKKLPKEWKEKTFFSTK